MDQAARPWIHDVRGALLLACCFALACAPAPRSERSGDAPAHEDTGPPQLLAGLGEQTHPITTSSDLAQRYFDQGLRLCYGFNHEAAVRSFRAGLEADPECAMCAWGVALAYGPNINAPMGPDAAVEAWTAIQLAQKLAPGASPREQAYIAALSERYAAHVPEERADLDLAYADAMRRLHRDHPSDADAATLFAESLMDLSPWNYWTAEGEPGKHTDEFIAALEGVLAADPQHLGANHYYIHAVEEHYPERAVPSAERLAALAPDAGHLVHMPTHIFWRVGRYEESVAWNELAVLADERFFASCRAGDFYGAAYYPHNLHFLWAAAATEGRSDLALTSARKLAARTAKDLERFPFAEEFQTMPILTLARFGRWDAVLAEPKPPKKHFYRHGIWRYARGLAHVRAGRHFKARASLRALEGLIERPEVQALALSGGVTTAQHLLRVAQAHLAGEIAAKHGDIDEALSELGRAVALQDTIPYMEPPPWYFPTRQALGAVLLEKGLAADAEVVYRRDLQQYPGNAWSLLGLEQSLRRQGKLAEADWARQGFSQASARADIEFSASRF